MKIFLPLSPSPPHFLDSADRAVELSAEAGNPVELCQNNSTGFPNLKLLGQGTQSWGKQRSRPAAFA
jgi:hypothetical protein